MYEDYDIVLVFARDYRVFEHYFFDSYYHGTNGYKKLNNHYIINELECKKYKYIYIDHNIFSQVVGHSDVDILLLYGWDETYHYEKILEISHLLSYGGKLLGEKEYMNDDLWEKWRTREILQYLKDDILNRFKLMDL